MSWTPHRDWPNELQELLVQAALGEGPRAVDAWREWKANVDIDQLDGGSQGLMPLVHQNLTRLGLDDPLLPFCKGFYRRAWYLNNLNFHAMTGVLRAFREVGIRQLLLLKGVALAVAHYGDIGLRPMGDFDFQVPIDQAPAATAMLVGWGWRPKSPLPREHGWDFVDEKNHKLDLHWYSLHACTKYGIDDDFWAASRPTLLNDVPVRVLCPTDQLLHVLAHGVVYQLGAPMRWIADAMIILRAQDTDPIDWDRLVAAAKTRDLAPVILEGLTYLRERFDTHVPTEVYRALEPPPPPVVVPPSIARRLRTCYQTHGALGVAKKAARKVVRLRKAS